MRRVLVSTSAAVADLGEERVRDPRQPQYLHDRIQAGGELVVFAPVARRDAGIGDHRRPERSPTGFEESLDPLGLSRAPDRWDTPHRVRRRIGRTFDLVIALRAYRGR